MRLEYKYLVPRDLLSRLRNEFTPFFENDSFTQQSATREYTVRSIYLDTITLDNYFEKMEGLSQRKKVRIRSYNSLTDDSVVFLEIKRKNQNFISKNRFPFKHGRLDELLQTGNLEDIMLAHNVDPRLAEDCSKFFFHLVKRSLRPMVLITYDREAFFCKFQPQLRVTFDKNVRSLLYPSLTNLFDDGDLHYAMPKYFVLEVKFLGGFPSWIRDIITRYRLKQTSVSKYTICLDSHKSFKSINRKTALAFASRIERNNSEYWRGAA